jgi:tetratricopeptide (TPR) repeat protein
MGYYRKAIEINPATTLGWFELARCYSKLGRTADAFEIYHKFLTVNVEDLHARTDIGLWYAEHQYFKEAEAALQMALNQNPGNYSLYEDLGELYFNMGDRQKAQEYLKTGQAMKDVAEAYLPSTIYHYNEIADIVYAHQAQLISMQYPLRGSASLERIFWSDYPIIFVENKDNFTKAMLQEGYNEYFSDSFGVYFGHCTPKGNRLIAENVAGVILSRLFPEIAK